MNKDVKRFFVAIAKQNGVSPSFVKREIQKTIDAAWQNENTNTEMQTKFPFGKPTLDEFFALALAE